MGKLKIGVVGGGRGLTMMRQLFKRDDAELVAVCDMHQPLLDGVKLEADNAGVTNIAYYQDFDKFMEHDMDAVVLANYANEHAPYAIKVLESGRHVMTECLTCATMKEAVELIEAVERTGLVYTYAENYCFTPARLEMRKRFFAGDFGELMYAEGEYLHDCSSIWPQISYGERNHWRNTMYSTFYCTHSIGPMLHMTGLRPKQVVGFETPNMPFMRELGSSCGSLAMEILTLENNAFIKSLHNYSKTSRHSNYELVGDRGGAQDLGDGRISVYTEKAHENCCGTYEIYRPEPLIKGTEYSGHGGGDYYTTHFFIRSILGDEQAKELAVDVYEAVDMCIPGILAYRSIVNGNVPVKVPNLRNKEERDAYRNDTFCTFKEIAGDMYVPNNRVDEPIPDSVYDKVRDMWKKGIHG